MWVRVATFEGGDTEKLDALMDERMSSGQMTTPDGMSSVLILDDKAVGKRKFLAFFDSREALDAAEAGFDQMGDTIPEEIRGRRASVHQYEVGIYDGDISAAKAARVSLLEGSPETIDAGIERARAETLPKLRSIGGSVGAIGLVDRDNGRYSMVTLWDSADSMRASSEQADQLRQQTADMSESTITNVALYDVSTAQVVEGARA